MKRGSIRRVRDTQNLWIIGWIAGIVVTAAFGADTPKAEDQAKLPPRDIVNADVWEPADIRGNTFEVTQLDGQDVLAATGRQFVITSKTTHGPNTRITMRFRMTDGQSNARITLSAGVQEATNLRELGLYASVHARKGMAYWTVHDPTSTDRRKETRGIYRPQFVVARSLTWPESLRRNVEADMIASAPLEARWLTLELTLRDDGYEAVLNGIPLTRVTTNSINTNGLLRLTLRQNLVLADVKVEKTPPADHTWVYRPISIQNLLNASTIDGKQIDPASLPASDDVELEGVPFELATPDRAGHDHIDIGTSWFRQGNLDGRFSGRGRDPMNGRWLGVMAADPSRLAIRIPMARYSAIHLIAAADSEDDAVPIITAQFYRPESGFPKNFTARVPAFTATAIDAVALPVKTRDGGKGRLYHVTIPVDPGALAEFDDLDYVEVELTKQVKLYRASPDPMYYSFHAAGRPSSAHVYAVTTERPAVDVALSADAYGHVWAAPATPKYTATLRKRRGAARNVQLELATISLDGKLRTSQKKTVKLADDQDVSVDFPLKLAAFGYHDVRLTVKDGDFTRTETRSLAYLHEDTRSRGDWDHGRGPLFGFWNWGGGHRTPPAEKQLAVMALAGIETIPGSYEQGIKRWGEATDKLIQQYGIFSLKFAGAGDHYITGRFAKALRDEGLEVARKKFLEDLEKARSKPGPNSRPTFISFYPEPSIGAVTHGIFPEYIGEPANVFTEAEQARYNLYYNGFMQGAKIIKENYPGVKTLMPHGDPAFVIHFLKRHPEITTLLDGITVDIPCFERLPEQQFHQVSIHRMHMVRNELAKAGISEPYLPMYEGPCVPSGPGALSNQAQADLTIRDSLMLINYGVNILNGGFPAFDTASYWGEQHYGFGILNRVSLETPKPAYAAVATLTRHLNRANFTKAVPTGSHTVFAFQFKHDRTGTLIHVMWTLRGKRPVTLAVAGGTSVSVFDQMDNVSTFTDDNGKITFTVDASPCYVEGLAEDAVITLGDPDHADAEPGAYAVKLGNAGDGSWTIKKQTEVDYEQSHTPYIYRYPAEMTATPTDAPAAQGGKALAVHFDQPKNDRVFVPYYSVLTPGQPIEIAGRASHLGLWVKGASDWGRAIYFVRDAKGEQWINVGTAGQWNCDDLHSWMSFNFDGWRYLRMELPANAGYDSYREFGSTWWGAYGEGDDIIDLPLTLEKIVVERRTHVMYADGPEPADMRDVLIGDLYAEYESAVDATDEAVRLSAIRMPVPTHIKGLENPIIPMREQGVGEPIVIKGITLPTHGADGTRCDVNFDAVEGAKQYDIYVSPYEDGEGALHLGKAWKEPGGQVRGLRPDQDFYLFVVYTDAEGKPSKPSAGFKIRLEDFFGMK